MGYFKFYVDNALETHYLKRKLSDNFS